MRVLSYNTFIPIGMKVLYKPIVVSLCLWLE